MDPTLLSGIRDSCWSAHDILNCFSPHLDSVNTCLEECSSSGKVPECDSFFEGLRSRDFGPLLVPCPMNISMLAKGGSQALGNTWCNALPQRPEQSVFLSLLLGRYGSRVLLASQHTVHDDVAVRKLSALCTVWMVSAWMLHRHGNIHHSIKIVVPLSIHPLLYCLANRQSKCSRVVRCRCKVCPLHSRERITSMSAVQLQSSPGCSHKAHRTYSSTRAT